MTMRETTRKVSPLIDLTGWDKLLEPHVSLEGQQSFLDDPGNEASTLAIPIYVGAGDTFKLFETGRDLPGAKETDQSILWDIAH